MSKPKPKILVPLILVSATGERQTVEFECKAYWYEGEGNERTLFVSLKEVVSSPFDFMPWLVSGMIG